MAFEIDVDQEIGIRLVYKQDRKCMVVSWLWFANKYSFEYNWTF